MTEMRELTIAETDAVAGGSWIDIDVIASFNGNFVSGQNATSAGNGIVVGSTVVVTQNATK